MTLGLILEQYPDAVVRAVTSPLTGIQSRCKFPPSIAEVKESCDAEVDRLERIGRYAAMGEPSRPRVSRRDPGCWANVFVPPTAPQYEKMIEKTRAPGTDKREWKLDSTRVGVWVALAWLRPDMATDSLHGAAMSSTSKLEPDMTPAQFRDEHGLTQEQWDAIPDQPEHAEYWRGVRRVGGQA